MSDNPLLYPTVEETNKNLYVKTLRDRLTLLNTQIKEIIACETAKFGKEEVEDEFDTGELPPRITQLIQFSELIDHLIINTDQQEIKRYADWFVIMQGNRHIYFSDLGERINDLYTFMTAGLHHFPEPSLKVEMIEDKEQKPVSEVGYPYNTEDEESAIQQAILESLKSSQENIFENLFKKFKFSEAPQTFNQYPQRFNDLPANVSELIRNFSFYRVSPSNTMESDEGPSNENTNTYSRI